MAGAAEDQRMQNNYYELSAVVFFKFMKFFIAEQFKFLIRVARYFINPVKIAANTVFNIPTNSA